MSSKHVPESELSGPIRSASARQDVRRDINEANGSGDYAPSRRSSRRTFLKGAGAGVLALVVAPLGFARAESSASRTPEPLSAPSSSTNTPMQIKRIGSQPSGKGPADWFTGTVRVDPLFQPAAPARTSGATVTFEPGARTAWHTHPLGQTLIITAGCGWVQQQGGPVEEVRPGDVVWFPPGEKHWHGATATTAMSHIAIQEALEGKAVDWMEKVTDEQYRK